MKVLQFEQEVPEKAGKGVTSREVVFRKKNSKGEKTSRGCSLWFDDLLLGPTGSLYFAGKGLCTLVLIIPEVTFPIKIEKIEQKQPATKGRIDLRRGNINLTFPPERNENRK